MTHDPHRDEPVGRRYRHPRDANRASASVAILLGALLLAAIGSFIYFYAGPGENVATNDIRPPITQPSTTGSAPAPDATDAAETRSAREPKAEPRMKPID
ncbi:hypothetical protein [Pseudorhodoplanes sp.]|uniref:hypothetical protein n=1 Tax=Pseudorhodoplanes sp. TaxID=1934341 RepID=UPI003D131E31